MSVRQGYRTTYAGQRVDVIAKSNRDDLIGFVQIRYVSDQSLQWLSLGALGELPVGLNVLQNLEVNDE